MSKFSEQFWVTNISNRNVSLTDLGLSIPAFKTVNLLDKKHYSFDKDILIESKTTGSLYIKRNKVKVREVPPTIDTSKQLLEIDTNALVPSRRRSVVKIEDIHYEELEIPDDLFAASAADLTDQYHKLK